MREIIASKYAKALVEQKDLATLQMYSKSLEELSKPFSVEKFREIVECPFVETDKKIELLSSAMKGEDKEFNNFIKLLASNDRLEIIPEISEVVRKMLSQTQNEYRGFVISKEPLDDMVIDSLQKAFSAKVGSSVLLSSRVEDYDGVKIVVEDLGYEIAFSKERLKEELVNHILKAI